VNERKEIWILKVDRRKTYFIEERYRNII